MGGRGANSPERLGAGESGRPNDATEYYVSGGGMWINQYLRGRGDFGELTESEKQYLRDLDTATNGAIGQDTLYRSVDARAIFGNSESIDNLFQYLQYGPDSWGSGEYAKSISDGVKDMLDKTIGSTITEKGFMSTTKSWDVAAGFQDFTGAQNPVVMEIKPGSKTRGVDLSGYDANVAEGDEQQEVLLKRDQSYKVNDVSVRNGQIVIHVEMR